MINFKTFLQEDSLDSIDEFWETVAKECSEIVSIYKDINVGADDDYFLYRGIKDAKINQLYIKKQIKQDRRPLEMNKHYHDILNDVSEKNGFKAHRGNSIFCSNSKYLSKVWGLPYIVFPKNGFEYTWFKKQNSEYMFDIWMNKINAIVSYEKGGDDGRPANTKLREIFMSYSPSKTMLDECLKSKKAQDILVTGSEYYGMNVSKTFQLNLLKSKLLGK